MTSTHPGGRGADADPPPGGRRAHAAALATAAVLLGLSALSRPVANDEGIFGYIARVWRQDGLAPYIGGIENKPPGVFYVFALGDAIDPGAVTFVRAAGVLFALLACHCAGIAARALAGPRAGWIAVLACGGTLAGLAVDGPYAAHTESFLIGCTAAGFPFAAGVCGGSRPVGAALVAGALAGLGFTFKQTGLAEGGAFALIAALAARQDRAGAVRRAGAVAAGFAAGAALALVPYLACGGTWNAYLDGTWRTLGATGRWATGEGLRSWLGAAWDAFSHPLPLLLAGVAAFALRCPRGGNRPLRLALLVWFAASFAAACASGSFWGHQLRQFVPPAACALAVAAAEITAPFARSVAARAALVLVSLAAFLPVVVVRDPERGLAGRRAAGERATAAWLREHAAPDDRVAMLAQTLNPTLWLSGLRAPSRQISTMFRTSAEARAEFLEGLADPRTRFAVLPLRDEGKLPDWLAPAVEASFTPVAEVGGNRVLERRR